MLFGELTWKEVEELKREEYRIHGHSSYRVNRAAWIASAFNYGQY